MLNWILWITGAALWGYVGYTIADAGVRTAIFAHRMGWRNARRFRISTWADWFLSPPDSVGEWYWPSKSGADMCIRDAASYARDLALLDSEDD